MSERLERAKAIVTAARQGEVEWTELEKSIAAELDTARSDLARKVLVELREVDLRNYNSLIVDGFIRAQTTIERFFTREQIDLGDEE